MEDISPDKLILAFIYAGNPSEPSNVEIKGKLLFIKEFFVFIKEVLPDWDSIFLFRPYDYGPYSFQLVNLLDELKRDGLIEENVVQLQSGKRYDYKLTSKGIEIAREVYGGFDPDIKQRLEKLRSDATKMGYLPVLNYVYSKYPEYTTASKIKDFVNNGS